MGPISRGIVGLQLCMLSGLLIDLLTFFIFSVGMHMWRA